VAAVTDNLVAEAEMAKRREAARRKAKKNQGGSPEPPVDDYEHSDEDDPNAPTGELLERGDHVELAERAVYEQRQKGELCHTGAEWCQYDEERGVHRDVEQAELARFLHSYAGRFVVRRGKQMQVVGFNDSTVRGVLSCMRNTVEVPGFFDEAPHGIMFENGFLRVSPEGELSLEEKSPEWRARFAHPFEFEAGAAPLKTLAYMLDVFGGDPDWQQKVDLLREHAGLSILGLAPRFQKALVLVGSGGNGKSQWLQLLPLLVPQGASTQVPPQEWGREYYRAELAGKLLNVVQEMPEAEIIGSEAFKAIVAGERITGRQPAGRVFRFAPRAGHIFAANTLPASQDNTHGFWRRMVVVQFNRRFEGAGARSDVWKELLPEIPKIVSWCIEGAVEALKRGGLAVPESSQGARDEWATETDPVRLFLREKTEPTPEDTAHSYGTTTQGLYTAYQRWCRLAGIRFPLTRPVFGRRLKAAGHKPHPSSGKDYYRLQLIWTEDDNLPDDDRP
jgi:P4 family phage/plasmid primase-like protien